MPRGGKRLCKTCHVNAANRPGGRCHVCCPNDAAQSKPPKKPPLSSDVEPDLAAMEHVWTRPAGEDRTYQHKSFRAMMEQNRGQFYDRMLELRRQSRPAQPPGPIEDPTSDMLEALCEKFLAETKP